MRAPQDEDDTGGEEALRQLEQRLRRRLDTRAGALRPVGKSDLLTGGHVTKSTSVTAQLELLSQHGVKTRPRYGRDPVP